MESHVRSFSKALSWRATGTLDTMILSWLITGSFRMAATISFAEVATKSLLYYLHERAWQRVPYGRRKVVGTSGS